MYLLHGSNLIPKEAIYFNNTLTISNAAYTNEGQHFDEYL